MVNNNREIIEKVQQLINNDTKEDIREMLYDCDFCGEEYVVMSGSRMTANALHKGCTAVYCPKCGRKLRRET